MVAPIYISPNPTSKIPLVNYYIRYIMSIHCLTIDNIAQYSYGIYMATKGIIYKVSSPSGKAYIGRCLGTLAERKRQHIYETKAYPNNEKRRNCPLFHNALRKWGDKMVWEVIFTADSVVSSQNWRITRDKRVRRWMTRPPFTRSTPLWIVLDYAVPPLFRMAIPRPPFLL